MDTARESLEKELTFSRFDTMCERYPDQTAVVYLGERFTYASLKDLSARFAGALSGMGVKKGDRVTIVVESSTLRITAAGVAKGQGSAGEQIRVQNLINDKEIFAAVVDSSTVKVNF